jgi:DtxR family transcriptional regulator, Mn-dependent transcriptional regulator
MQTQSVENYLKTVYAVQREHGRAETSVLAERLGVASSSVTQMLKKLAREQLVAYSPYKGVVLTQAGQRSALQIIRRHRLIELYLVKELGVPWDEVHAEADKWEHVLSKQLEERPVTRAKPCASERVNARTNRRRGRTQRRSTPHVTLPR